MSTLGCKKLTGSAGGAGVSGLTSADGGTAIADNVLIRGDGTDGIQGSAVAMSDSGDITMAAGGLITSAHGAQHGVIKFQAGLNAPLAIVSSTTPANCFQFTASNFVARSTVGGNALAAVDSGGVDLDTTGTVDWSGTAGSAQASKDVGIARAAAGDLRVTNGSSSIGDLYHGVPVEANTAVAASPNILVANESGAALTNEGATAANYHTLPTAAAGYRYTFVVQDADGMRVVANTDDTIRVIDKVTAAAGYIESTTIGSVVTLLAINATEWVATSIHGVWTDGTFTYDDTGNTSP